MFVWRRRRQRLRCRVPGAAAPHARRREDGRPRCRSRWAHVRLEDRGDVRERRAGGRQEADHGADRRGRSRDAGTSPLCIPCPFVPPFHQATFTRKLAGRPSRRRYRARRRPPAAVWARELRRLREQRRLAGPALEQPRGGAQGHVGEPDADAADHI